MDIYVKVVLIVSVVVIVVVLRSRKKAAPVVSSDWREGELEQVLQAQPSVPLSIQAPKVRLTEIQSVALNSASLGYVLYPDSKFQREKDELETYSLKTIDSLVKRGFLELNDSGGYVITPAGSDSLRKINGY
ncbi:hypothetical protein [Pseudomonas sp. BIGb0164]|uniref:hypothetical protein n=1 Tax=Pseudomonas sp. BIGb0164 TaxID=2940605 RepID=UPI0021673E1C|nr:hypothetical protein [Pseudomonas sp. BIGb0164]MCS4250628.1 hypothetical protein [Pseudomonas sp. BIGb0164]